MIPYKPRDATTVPKTLEKRLEVMAAIRTLAAQEDEQLQQRRAEIGALRRELELLRDSLPELVRRSIAEIRRECEPLLRSHVQKYNADQPRVPAGNPDGGQWTSEGESGAAPANDSRVISDATPDNTWKPGAQYAASNVEDRGAANDNLTPEQTCQQAYSDAVALARINPSLSTADYLLAREDSASSLDFCLHLANGERPISLNGDFVDFFGGGVVIFRQGRPPIYVPPPGRQ